MHQKFVTHLKLHFVIAALFLCTITIHTHAQTNTAPTFPTKDPLNVFGSKDNLQIIQHPTSVLAYRIDPYSYLESKETLKALKAKGEHLTPKELKRLKAPDHPETVIANYDILSGPVKLSTNSIQQLSTLWSNPKSFANISTDCGFSPGIALKYTRDKKEIILLICLDCYEVDAVIGDKTVGYAKLFPIANQITTFAKQIFPKDQKIQAIGTTKFQDPPLAPKQ